MIKNKELLKSPPAIPLEVVEWLEAVFEDRFPEVVGTDVQAIGAGILRRSGALEVVKMLRNHHTRQSQKPPKNEASV